MKRKVFVLLTVLAILCSIAVPAFAAPIEESIWDYADVQVDGFTKDVTVRFPDQLVEISLIGNNWTVLDNELGNDSTFDLTGYPSNIRVFFSPLGYWFNPYGDSVYDGVALDLSDIPSDATFSVSASARADWIDYGTGNLFMAWFNDGHIVPSNGLLGYKRESLMTLSQPESSVWSATYEGTFGDTSLLYACQVQFAFESNSSGRWHFTLDDFVIHTSIDALKQLEANTGRTNELLDEANKKLDEIINGEVPTPDDPSNGQGDALDNQTQQILDTIQGNIEYLHNLILQWSSTIDDLAESFQSWGEILFFFLNIPWVSTLLITSICFGCCATLFGVVAGLFKKE